MQVQEGMRDKCVLLQLQGNLLGEGATNGGPESGPAAQGLGARCW